MEYIIAMFVTLSGIITAIGTTFLSISEGLSPFFILFPCVLVFFTLAPLYIKHKEKLEAKSRGVKSHF